MELGKMKLGEKLKEAVDEWLPDYNQAGKGQTTGTGGL
jgi:hypothetical protein